MNIVIAVLIVSSLQSAPLSGQTLSALKGFLESQPPVRPTSRSVEYRVSYKSSHQGKPKGEFKESGVLFIGTTKQGNTWASAPQQAAHDLQIGEIAPPVEGQNWFNQAVSPFKLAALADPGSVLIRLLRRLQLKSEAPPAVGNGEPGEVILVYPLEASRPGGKFWTFNVKAGEARLKVKKDGTPISLEVVQAYQGELSPHFGEYRLNRKETWTFSGSASQWQTTKYQLSLSRKDWKDAVEADLEMIVGARQ